MFKKFKNIILNVFPNFINHPLWSEKKLIPFLRFFSLQIAFAKGNKIVKVKWINDLILPIEKGDHSLSGNYYLGLMEFYDMSFLLHFLRKNDLFIDIGANLGSYSLLASGILSARSIAFEPVTKSFNKLKINIDINQLSNLVDIRQIALTSPDEFKERRELYFSADKGAMNSFVDSSYEGSIQAVNVSYLDKECHSLQPKLIKIDIEGFEEKLLKGSREVLENQNLWAIIIEGQTNFVNDILREYGFRDYTYNPLDRELKPHFHNSINRIWIRKNKFNYVRSRIEKSKIIRVYGQEI